MGQNATGTAIVWVHGIATTRIRVHGKRETIHLSSARDEAQAIERRRQLVELERRMRGVDRESAVAALRRTAAAPAGQKLKAACIVVDKLIGGWRPPSSSCITLGELAEQWLSGELHRRYPKTVKRKQSTGPARANLVRYVFPTLRDVPVDAITLEACDAIKNSLGHLRDNSARQVLAPLKVVLDYAVEPLRLIERSPLPAKWLPPEGETRTLRWLYPSEDAQLMACTAVPLWQRVLFGYLIREGGRVNEPLAQTIAQFDFVGGRNTAYLAKHQTKTRHARLWRLEPGTARALQRWFELRGAGVREYAFTNAHGRKVNTKTIKLPEELRRALALAGVTRAELFARGPEERPICVHDLRRSFVTIKLSLGMPEDWIASRTGHLTSTELAGYREAARTFAELEAGDLLPLDVAIPELRCTQVSDDQPVTSAPAKHAESFGSQHSMVKHGPDSQALGITQFPMVPPDAGTAFPTISEHTGQSAAARIAELEARIALLTQALGGAPEARG